MSDLEELRDAYVEHTLGHKPCTSLDDWAGERFDAILAQHDRKIAAEALAELIAEADASSAVTWAGPGGVKEIAQRMLDGVNGGA